MDWVVKIAPNIVQPRSYSCDLSKVCLSSIISLLRQEYAVDVTRCADWMYSCIAKQCDTFPMRSIRPRISQVPDMLARTRMNNPNDFLCLRSIDSYPMNLWCSHTDIACRPTSVLLQRFLFLHMPPIFVPERGRFYPSCCRDGNISTASAVTLYAVVLVPCWYAAIGQVYLPFVIPNISIDPFDWFCMLVAWSRCANQQAVFWKSPPSAVHFSILQHLFRV